jgi:hypothetical protein
MGDRIIIDFLGSDPIKSRILQQMAERYIRDVRAVLGIPKTDIVHVLCRD